MPAARWIASSGSSPSPHRRLAHGQKREFGVAKRLFHNLLQRQPFVNEDESAIGWVDGIPNAVASEVYPAAFRHMIQHSRKSRAFVIQMSEMKAPSFVSKDLNDVGFIHRPGSGSWPGVAGWVTMSSVTAFREAALSIQKRCKSRGI